MLNGIQGRIVPYSLFFGSVRAHRIHLTLPTSPLQQLHQQQPPNS